MSDIAFIEDLERLIRERMTASPETSYTARLASRGVAAGAQKVGEEGVEVALAAVAGSRDELVGEAADLLYHLLVVLAMRETSIGDVAAELEKRHRQRTGAGG